MDGLYLQLPLKTSEQLYSYLSSLITQNKTTEVPLFKLPYN